jgi:hypothetical protein
MSIGEPDFITHCLANKVAQCECVILQPAPECNVSSKSGGGTLLQTHKNADNTRMLVPSGARLLVLWRDMDEYYLTAVKEEKDEVRICILQSTCYNL